MCGIAGLLSAGRGETALAALAREMAGTLAHRGPDAEGVWADQDVGLGHRRLAIVGLGPDGAQPMISEGERYVLVLNGEIYNHRALRRELEARGARFRGGSDTEVLLALIDERGLQESLRMSVGMFALALWDRRTRTLELARDRMGEKPLYYATLRDGFAFASELRALRRVAGWDRALDPSAVSALLGVGYVPAPASIHRGARKLAPGTILRVAEGGARVEERTYWSLAEVALAGVERPYAGSEEKATDALEHALRASIRDQCLADVPLGAFLSGGIDSSTVVALMRAEASSAVRTFTVGFDDPELDEAPHARAIARHLGTEHTELRATGAAALEVVERIAELFDEPLGDYSQIPTYLVSKLTRAHVTVALSADGGDELFAGYNTYAWALRAWSVLRWLPRPAAAVARAGSSLTLIDHLPVRGQRLADLAASSGPLDLYRRLTRHWTSRGWHADRAPCDPRSTLPSFGHPLLDMRALDAATYLPGDILAKVDRASMAVSLEARAPLLDHRIVELALSLPPRMLRRDGRSKWLLRRVLDRHVPRALVEQPKMGFSPPMATWLRGPLRDWAEALLAPPRLVELGLDAARVDRHWREHLGGKRDWKFLLWDVLALSAWAERWGTS